MAGFALIFHRDEAPVERNHFSALLAALDHRGPDGRHSVWLGASALGHQHFWTVPEEVGERQPVGDREGGVHVALDGRLDNRRELAAALGPEVAPSASDAELVFRAYRRWGESCFERLLGPFAVAVLDAHRRRVVCARDALGDRPLVYFLAPGLLLVASEEQALLAHPAVSSRLDETTLARFFAVQAPAPGDTFFADLRELPPGCALRVDATGTRSWRHWTPAPEQRLRYRADAGYAEHLRQVLTASVRCRLRGEAAPAVLMSGGLDSTSVAAVAAGELAARGAGRPLRAISWVFDDLRESDEREFMQPVAAAFRLEARPIPGDDAWPLRDLATWPRNPNAPLESVYRGLQDRAYAAVREGGGRTLLTGEFGDHLFAGGAYWLRDLLLEGRLATAGRDLFACLGERNGASRVPLRTALARTLGRRPGVAAPPPWLTTEARERLAGDTDGLPAWWGSPDRRQRLASLLDPQGARAASLEVATASRAGVEVRRPYRDRRLVEFFLSLPAHQLYRPGWSKWILRQAMRDVLPEPVRCRRRPTSLMPLAARGLTERRAGAVAEVLRGRDALWRKYVRADWLAAVYPDRIRSGVDGVEVVVPWWCVCLELWRRRFSYG